MIMVVIVFFLRMIVGGKGRDDYSNREDHEASAMIAGFRSELRKCRMYEEYPTKVWIYL